MGANFRNIELEVRAEYELQALTEALGEEFSVNYCGETEPGKFLLSGAFDGDSDDDDMPITPDDFAIGLCKLIEKLPSSVKELWYGAQDRVFDVGLDANLDHQNYILNLFTPEVLALISGIKARIAVSVYAHDIEDQLKIDQ